MMDTSPPTEGSMNVGTFPEVPQSANLSPSFIGTLLPWSYNNINGSTGGRPLYEDIAQISSENLWPTEEKTEDIKKQTRSIPTVDNWVYQYGYDEQQGYPIPPDFNGYQYEYGQRGYPPTYDPNLPVYYDYINIVPYYTSDRTSLTNGNNDIGYFPGNGYPVIDYSQFQGYSNGNVDRPYNRWQENWQNYYYSLSASHKYIKPRIHQSTTQLHSSGKVPLKIADTPANTLTEEEKAEYDIFKEEYTRQVKNRDFIPMTDERKQIFKRVINNYPIYAGIPSDVNYVLGEYKEGSFYPRQLPAQPMLKLTTEEAMKQIREKAEEFISYHQSMEWDRTEGWSPLERISLIDADARTIAQQTKSLASQGPISTIYVILMHDVPEDDIRVTLKENDGSPIPSLEPRGDILETITGEKRCRIQATQIPLISHKWKGEFALCGNKLDKIKGGSKEMVIRGRHDVCKIYETVLRENLTRKTTTTKP